MKRAQGTSSIAIVKAGISWMLSSFYLGEAKIWAKLYIEIAEKSLKNLS